MAGSALRRSVAAGGFGLLVTAAVIAVPSLRFAYRSTAGHLVLETAVSLVAGLVALLLYGRYRRRALLPDLLLTYALSLLSVTALAFVTLPALLEPREGETASSWAAVVVRLAAAVLFVAAALVAPGRTRRVMRPLRDAIGIALALVAAGVVAYALASVLPTAVAVTIPAEASGRPAFEGHPVVLAAQVVNLACYAVAAVVFTRRSARDDDELLGWLGAAAAVGAWARVLYLLFPSLYTEWLYAGDVLRLASYVLLLVGAVREIRAYWEAQVFVAADTERRRVARDLHDGVIQELGFILAESRRTAGPASLDAIGAAAGRALDEAREAVTALASPPDEPLAVALHRAANEVADRYDVPVRSSLDESVHVAPDARVQLVRIVREAVANAARHADPPAVTVTLSPGLLEVQDAGRGFDIGARNGGFGLTSMRERAQTIGATVAVDSRPGHGTRVRVEW